MRNSSAGEAGRLSVAGDAENHNTFIPCIHILSSPKLGIAQLAWSRKAVTKGLGYIRRRGASGRMRRGGVMLKTRREFLRDGSAGLAGAVGVAGAAILPGVAAAENGGGVEHGRESLQE